MLADVAIRRTAGTDYNAFLFFLPVGRRDRLALIGREMGDFDEPRKGRTDVDAGGVARPNIVEFQGDAIDGHGPYAPSSVGRNTCC
jgi:hypothetical protein